MSHLIETVVPHLVPRTVAHLGVTQLNVLPRHKPWVHTKPGRAMPGRLVQPRRPGLQPLGGVGCRCQHPEPVAASPRLPLSGVRPASPGARKRDHARPEPPASPPPGTHRGCQRAAAATSRPRLPEPRSAATPQKPPGGRSGPSPLGLGGGDCPGRGFLRKESSSFRVTHAAHPDWRWR